MTSGGMKVCDDDVRQDCIARMSNEGVLEAEGGKDVHAMKCDGGSSTFVRPGTMIRHVVYFQPLKVGNPHGFSHPP